MWHSLSSGNEERGVMTFLAKSISRWSRSHTKESSRARGLILEDKYSAVQSQSSSISPEMEWEPSIGAL